MTGGQLDASSCSSASSGQSDKKKRSSSSHEDDANFKTYQCRFYTMKFAKLQALGGHMNRHRQEREREKLQNAETLLLRQRLPHYFSTDLAYALGGLAGDLGPPSLPRSSSNNSLKDGMPTSSATMLVGSVDRNFQTGKFHHAVNAPSLRTQGIGHESSLHATSAFNLDPMLHSYHTSHPRYSMPSNCPASSCFIQAPNLHDQLLNPLHYNKQVQLSSFPFDATNSNPLTHQGESLLSQHVAQTHLQGESFLANTPNAATFVPQMNQRCVHWRSTELAFQEDLGQLKNTKTK